MAAKKTEPPRIKPLVDRFGVIREAFRILADDALRVKFLAALAELEDNEAYRTATFPVTKLHKVTGIKQAIYRAYVDKISGWRLHLQFQSGELHLKDILTPDKHDRVIESIHAKRDRYQ